MFKKLKVIAVCSSLVVVAIATAHSNAQAPVPGNPRPLSRPGGFASTELNTIYRNSVGTGYSVSTTNQQALFNSRARVENVGQSAAGMGRIGLGLDSGGPANKPFGNYSAAPTVSPYLNLFREDLNGGSDLNYQTLVRPQLQQQQFNQQMQQAGRDISRRMQSIAAQSDFNPSGNVHAPPTGHQTVFNYTGRYYPVQQRRR